MTRIKNFKGNNTQAFDKHFMRINLINPQSLDVNYSRIDFVCGGIRKVFYNPVFPLYVDFTSEETAKLSFNNVGYLIAYDNLGRSEQCQGYIEFSFQNGVIKVNGGRTC